MKDLVDRQRNDVRRAFIGAESPYVVRKEYEEYIDRSFFEKNPGNRTWSSKKAVIQPERYKEVLQYTSKPPSSAHKGSGAHDLQVHDDSRGLEKMESLCQEDLAGSFTRNDIHSLTGKAKQLVSDKAIREGFEPQSFLIKSSSKASPHVVKSSPNGTFICDSDCLGYKTRKICSHVIAVAFTQNKLQECLSHFKSGKTAVTLTSSTTCNVNKNAGLKRPRVRKGRSKSPDTMTSMKQGKTLGDLFNEMPSDNEYSAETTSSEPLKLTFRKKRPAKPQVTPTTNTPYQLIDITGRIRKCAGCGGDLKDGPDPFSHHELDAYLCIRHKEHDFVWLETNRQWKKTFENKHYHIFSNCIIGRNGETFKVSSVDIALNHTIGQNEMSFLKKRFPSM
jgi:hypothetical protein